MGFIRSSHPFALLWLQTVRASHPRHHPRRLSGQFLELLLVVRLPMQLLEHHGDRNGRNIRGLSEWPDHVLTHVTTAMPASFSDFIWAGNNGTIWRRRMNDNGVCVQVHVFHLLRL
jgi:hypothetical protein